MFVARLEGMQKETFCIRVDVESYPHQKFLRSILAAVLNAEITELKNKDPVKERMNKSIAFLSKDHCQCKIPDPSTDWTSMGNEKS